MRRVTELFVDNPVMEKDALTQLRAPKYLGGVTVAVAGMFVIVAGVFSTVEQSAVQLAQYGTFHASGRALFALLVAGALGLASFVVPALGASAIAAERERGTLPLITATALSPWRIVAGKLGGLLVGIAPFFLPLLALLPLAHVYGDVSPLQVGLGLVAVAWHVVCISAIAIGASAASKKLRGAAPLALVAAAIVSLPGALPIGIACGLFVDHDKPEQMIPLILSGVFLETVLAVAALLWAKSELSFKADARWRHRRSVMVLLVTVFPVVCALVSSLYARDTSDVAGLIGVLHMEAVIVAVIVILVEVLGANRHRADGRTPLRQAWIMTGLAAVGLFAARFTPTPEAVHSYDELIWRLQLGSLFYLVGYVAFATTLAAAVSRFIQRVPIRTAVLLALVFANLMVPVVLHEGIRSLIDLGALDLSWTHMPLLINDLQRFSYPNEVNHTLGVAFFVVAPLVLSLVARRKTR